MLLLAGLTLAQVPEPDTARVVNLITAGAAEQALAEIRGDFAAYLAEFPDQALLVCTAAAESAERHTERSPGEWAELADQLIEVGRKSASTYESDGDALAAQAEAFLCRARIRARAARRGVDPGDWGQAVVNYCKAERVAPQEGQALERALSLVRQASECDNALPADVLETAAEICDQVARQYAGNDGYREVAHRFRLYHVCRSLEESRSQGKKALRAYLTRLQTQLARTPQDLLAVTAHNDTVTLARRERVAGVRARYRTKTVIFKRQLLELTHPDGKRWKWTGCGQRKLIQHDLDGRPIRTIHLATYGWR